MIANPTPASPPAHSLFTHQNLPLRLLQARELLLARFRPIIKQAGFTEQQWRIVRALVEHGALEPRQIVSMCGISSPSLAGILARMQELGYITKTSFPSDQRRISVEATQHSRQVAAQLAVHIEATYAQLETELGAARVQALYAQLESLITALQPPT